jgi:class 3 adenylate cyclase/pimeloyl-ACP methyl ester carboxylesterase
MEPAIQYCRTADGIDIAYYAMGDGPTLVIASWVLFSTLKLRFFPEFHRDGHGLGRHKRIVRYDSRGTGLSDRDAVDLSLDARVLDLASVVNHLQLDNFVLLATTHATPTAVAYASANQERVSSLILYNPYFDGADVVGRMGRFDSLRASAASDFETYTLTMASVNTGFQDADLARRLARRFREAMTPEAVLAFIEATRLIDVSSLVPEIAVPTLVLYQDNESAIITIEEAKYAAGSIPGARLVTANGTGGNFMIAERIVKAAEEFLGPTPPEEPVHAIGSSAFRTVLFTDLVGHTEMMSRLGDEGGREVLREHERITREMLKAHGGTEVKTMGDGFMASFGSVTKAVECAVALQKAFADREGEPLSVRVGLNAGEPIEEDGDLFGATVILASRIAAKADGGEILVSDNVRSLCSGKGFQFADCGDFVAKGFEEPVRVYEVSWREGSR